MAEISIHILTGGSAFEGDRNSEIARILRKLATELDSDPTANFRSLRDLNGNVVGHFETLRDGETTRKISTR